MWCTPEYTKAIQKGYTLVRIHQMWHFPESQVGLFQNYVDTCLKIKEEASGFPSNCTTPEECKRHISAYGAAEGVELEPEQMQKNPGRRQVAKLMLNSMWGKFGQRLDKLNVKELTRPQQLEEFLSSGKHNIRYVCPLTEERVELHYRTKDEMIDVAPNLNIFVACFTICHARLKLFDTLDFLQKRVLYFDTDSIIFIKDDDPLFNPQVGKYLGEFKDELGGGNILEFCSGSRNNYGD